MRGGLFYFRGQGLFFVVVKIRKSNDYNNDGIINCNIYQRISEDLDYSE